MLQLEHTHTAVMQSLLQGNRQGKEWIKNISKILAQSCANVEILLSWEAILSLKFAAIIFVDKERSFY